MAVAVLFIFVTIAKSSVALHASVELATGIAEFESLTLEQQIELTEQTLYTDLSKVELLLVVIIPRLDFGSKNQRHRVRLLQAYLALSTGEVTLADDLLEKIQLDHPGASTLARLLYLRSRVAQFRNDYLTAFNYLNKADLLPKDQISINNQFYLLMLAADLNSIAARYNAAIDYIEQAIALAQQLDDLDLICFALAGIPSVLVEMKNHNTLELESNKAIAACEKSESKVLQANIYLDFSHVYFDRGNYKLQQQLLKRAIDIFGQYSTEFNIPPAKLLLVNSYIADRQLVRAEFLLNELFEFVAQEWGESEAKLLYLAKSSLLEQQGLTDKALLYYKKYLALAQQERQSGMLTHVAYLQAQFDSKINIELTKVSELEQQYIAGVSKVASLQVWLLLVGATLLLSIPAYGLTFYHRRKKISVIEADNFDELTSVYHFEQGLQQARTMLHSQRHSFEYYGVATVDIDSMKSINHSFNHDFGDRLIRAFATEIKNIFADCGVITRVRRNDFVIFCSINDQSEFTRRLTQVQLRLGNLIIDRHNPNATCSIGYAVEAVAVDTDISDLCSQLVGKASIASRHAKLNGGNRWTRYDESIAIHYAHEYQIDKYCDPVSNDVEPF